MPIAIRPLQERDCPAIAEIVDASPLWQRHRFPGSRAATLMPAAQSNGDQIIVAEDEGLVVGFAWWMRKGAFGRSPYLRLIGVRPDRTGQSIGSILLRRFEEDSKTISNDCFLLVSDFNTGAQRFYEREGYKLVGTLPAYVLPDAAELLFRKVLKPILTTPPR